jgi:hypothetical protein
VPLALALLKELSTEAHLERAHSAAAICDCNHHSGATAPGAQEQIDPAKAKGRLYVELTEHRFNGVTRCC